MPSYGDHYGSNMSAAYGNPFAPIEQRINPWTAQEIVALQRRLSTRLGPEYLSTRPGPGGQKVCYLTGPTVINLANEVFGFNGWSSAIQNVVVDEVTQNPNTGKFSVCVSVVVRVTLRDGTYHEDLGYGHCENMKEKFQALEKAKKEGVTDGLKRAMRTFGNVLGNGLYEKDYQDALKRTKTNRVKLDGNTFKRMSSFGPGDAGLSRTNSMNQAMPPQPIKTEPEDLPAPQPPDQTVVEGEDIMDLEEDFGSDLFEEAADLGEPIMALDPTEDTTDAARLQAQPPQRTDQPQFQAANPINNPNQFITPSKPPNRSWQPGRAAVPSRLQPGQQRWNGGPAAPDAASSRTAGQLQQQQQQAQAQAQAQQRQRQQRPQPAESKGAPQAPPQAPADPNLTDLPPPLPGAKAEDADQTPVIPPEIPEDKRPPDPAGGFYSAKAADLLRNNPYAAPKAAPAFDPSFDSPSIRKTAGFDHRTSAPVARDTYTILRPQGQGQSQFTPGLSQSETPLAARRTPGPAGLGGAGRGMSTTSYKPPTRRIPPAPTESKGEGSNSAAVSGGVVGVNGKRSPLNDASNGGKTSSSNAEEATKRAKLSADANQDSSKK